MPHPAASCGTTDPAEAASALSAMPGLAAVIVADRYLLEEPLGQGSYGTVWAARDVLTGEARAVKLLHAAHHDTERVRDRFAREASIVRALEHPSVAAAYELVPHEGGLALVMQRIEGRSLRAELRQRDAEHRLPSRASVMALASALAQGLAHAHARGVVHRDLKPANVMLTPEGRAVILDFGLARLLEPEHEDAHTTVGRVVGTPLYMAPEQAAGEVAGPPADVFALASILFEVATLDYAWLRDPSGARIPVGARISGPLRAPNAHGAIAARIATAPAGQRLEVADRRPDLPAGLVIWIARAGAVSPAERPSIGELLVMLEGPAEGGWTPAPAVGAEPGAPAERHDEDDDDDDDDDDHGPSAIAPPSPGADPDSPLRDDRADRAYLVIALVMATVGVLLAVLILREGPAAVLVVETAAAGAAQGRGAELAAHPAPASAAGPPTPPATLVAPPAALAGAASSSAVLASAPGADGPIAGAAGSAIDGAPRATPALRAALTATVAPLDAIALDPARSPPTARAASTAPRTLLPAATFLRGCAPHAPAGSCDPDELPPTPTTVAAFALDRTEVTAAAYDACVAAGACTPASAHEIHCTSGQPALADRPINCVDADQAATYCRAHGGRLPTAAEWERAARGPEARTFPWGEAPPTCARANLGGCGGAPAPVGSRATADEPLADLAGNVWEWTADGTAARREIRGGSFYDLGPALRSSNRGWADARTRVEQLGFRCAR